MDLDKNISNNINNRNNKYEIITDLKKLKKDVKDLPPVSGKAQLTRKINKSIDYMFTFKCIYRNAELIYKERLKEYNILLSKATADRKKA